MERVELARLLGTASSGAPPPQGPIVIEERETVRFQQAFAEGAAGSGPVFLVDPNWDLAERVALASWVASVESGVVASPLDGWLMIPSGGTSGRLKFARHDGKTIAAAVRGFCAHFQLERVNAVGVLPLHHVGGLMAWLRTVISGGAFLAWDWKRLENGEFPRLAPPRDDWVISLVPTQLQRLCTSAAAREWLKQFKIIFVGGAPTWPELANAAEQAGLRVSLGYGMTETAAMVAALQPDEFLAGARSCGAPMPHVRVTLDTSGAVQVEGESVFRGYFPDWCADRLFLPDDVGEFDSRGHLHVLGRRDAAIMTGGKKVFPNEIEAALRATGEFADVAVLGIPDQEWGEAVVACYPASGRTPVWNAAIAGLAGYKRPKRFVAVENWPRNAQGKLNRAALLAEVVRCQMSDVRR